MNEKMFFLTFLVHVGLRNNFIHCATQRQCLRSSVFLHVTQCMDWHCESVNTLNVNFDYSICFYLLSCRTYALVPFSLKEQGYVKCIYSTSLCGKMGAEHLSGALQQQRTSAYQISMYTGGCMSICVKRHFRGLLLPKCILIMSALYYLHFDSYFINRKFFCPN